MTDGTDQVQAWKDADARDGAAADHPAGEMRLSAIKRVGLRVSGLAGLAIAAGYLAAGTPNTNTTCHYGCGPWGG